MKTRLVLIWMLGWKLCDGIVTWINCGLLGIPEKNPIIVSMADTIGLGYFVAIPYLLATGVLGILCYHGIHQDYRYKRILIIPSVFGFISLFLTAPMGPMSHLLYYYNFNSPEFVTISMYVTFLISGLLIIYIYNSDRQYKIQAKIRAVEQFSARAKRDNLLISICMHCIKELKVVQSDSRHQGISHGLCGYCLNKHYKKEV